MINGMVVGVTVGVYSGVTVGVTVGVIGSIGIIGVILGVTVGVTAGVAAGVAVGVTVGLSVLLRSSKVTYSPSASTNNGVSGVTVGVVVCPYGRPVTIKYSLSKSWSYGFWKISSAISASVLRGNLPAVISTVP
jgi:hypothetical protein